MEDDRTCKVWTTETGLWQEIRLPKDSVRLIRKLGVAK